MTAPAPPRRRFPALLAIGVLVSVVLLALAGVRGWRDLAGQRAREAELEREIEATEAEIELLRDRIRRLRSDPLALERVAREELGLVRPDDLVVVFPEDAPAPPPESVAAEPEPPRPLPPEQAVEQAPAGDQAAPASPPGEEAGPERGDDPLEPPPAGEAAPPDGA